MPDQPPRPFWVWLDDLMSGKRTAPLPASQLPGSHAVQGRGCVASSVGTLLWGFALVIAAWQGFMLLIGSSGEASVMIAHACQATAFCVCAFVIARAFESLSRPE
jgi:hypothetical protein